MIDKPDYERLLELAEKWAVEEYNQGRGLGGDKARAAEKNYRTFLENLLCND